MRFRWTIHIYLVILTSLLLTSSFNFRPGPVIPQPGQKEPPFLDTGNAWVDSVYESLSMEERIAQLLMVRAYSNQGPEHVESILEMIRQFNIGGLCFFQGGPARQVKLTNLYQSHAKTPLLIAQDFEWGLGMRLDSTLSYPRQMMLGAVQEEEWIYQMGLDIAFQMQRIGVHMNLAPVLDVNNNPLNPVINSRSFGEDVRNVSRKGIAYFKGLQDGGVLCTAKHFPGHGDTESDSHHTLPVIRHGRERLRATELPPFQEAIREGLSGVMIAHLHLPALDSTANLASSLSADIVTGLLKGEMGFKGLIATDALDMAGADQFQKPGDLEALAFEAGNDLLLIPSDINRAISAIRKKIRNGQISPDRLEESCKKILAAKYWAGLDRVRPLSTDNLQEDLHRSEYRMTQSRLVKSALTLVENKGDILPLMDLDTLKLATVAIGSTDINSFQEYIDLYLPARHFNIRKDAPAVDYIQLMNGLDSFNLVIAGVHNTDMRVSRDYGIMENSVLFLNMLSRLKPTIACVFANPYSLDRSSFGDRFAGLLMCYEDTELALQACPQLIFGGIPARGKLPVSSGRIFALGAGINTTGGHRLSYGLPEEAGMDAGQLYRVDSLAQDAIRQKAIPGCQVLAARNGLVFYHKAFGHHTYAERVPVKKTDLYDIASITKITSTLPILMQLTEKGKFDVEDSLKNYLPSLDSNGKGDLVIREILTHQAGLFPFIPFYYSTIEPMDPSESLISRKMSWRYPFRLSNHTFLNRNLTYVEGVYADAFSDDFPIQVAEDLYLNKTYMDSLWDWIVHSEMLRKKEYQYSDLGYYFLHRIIEEITGVPMEEYIREFLFDPLGAGNMGYLPLQRLPKTAIVPTENDLVFRRQVLQGYVHDQGAAMMGGVASHAGVFSHANDLAKIMQMYLNGGSYGGRQFIDPEVLDLFNSTPNLKKGNRRGIGFDKPEMDYDEEGPTCQCVSPSSFGHTGFTGTMAWADPEPGMLYIFLSNRIHPDQDNPRLVEMNVRTKIQEVFHTAVLNE
jgi:beta-glucosidase-like glycosyl hydrolase/CubicO group peptidase (beta-lactamase class C family)